MIFKKLCLIIFVFTMLLSCGILARDSDKKMHEEVLAAAGKGEQSLISWMKQNRDRVDRDYILAVTQVGVDKRSGGLVSIAITLAREKCDIETSAEVDFLTGNYLYCICYYQRAMDYYDKALAFFEKIGDPEKLAVIYYQKGATYREMGKYFDTIEMCKKSGSLYEKAGNLQMQSNSNVLLALAYSDQGNRSKALEILENELLINEKSGNSTGIAQVCWRMGNVLLYIGKTHRAIQMLQRALSCYGDEGYELERASVYDEKGSCYFFSGDYSRALEMYEKALVLFEKNKEAWGIGNVYYKMGETYFARGNIIRALKMYEKAFHFFQQTGNETYQSDVYRGKAYIYSITGNLLRAQEMYDKSLALYEESGNISGKAVIYLGKADIFRRNKEYDKSIDMYKKALMLFKKNESPWVEGWICLGKATIYLEKLDLDIAVEMYQEALTIFKKLDFPQPCADAYLCLGNAYFLKKNYGKALDMSDKAMEIYIKYANLEFRSFLLIQKAAALAMQFRLDEAFKLIEESFLYLDRFRAETAFSQMKRTIMEDFYDLYEIVVEFMMDFQYYERGFKYAEYIKARVFLDQLSEGLVGLGKGISQELLEKRDKLIAALSLQSKKINEAVLKRDNEELKALREEYQQIHRKFEDLLLKIRLNNPLYASVRYPEPVTLQDLQQHILREEEVLLRYLITKHSIYVYVISQDTFKVVKLKAKVGDIEKYVNRYLLSVRSKNRQKIIENEKRFYDMFFREVEPVLQGKKAIIIIPDGELAKIPFESFVIENTNPDSPVYLLEKYRIKYIQGATILATLRKHYYRERMTAHFIGFGDPVYDYENFKQGKPEHGTPDEVKGNEIKQILRGKYDNEGGLHNRLAGSGQEVEDVAELFKKKNQKSTIYLREKATEDNARTADMKEYDYIHFSCHGILGESFQSLVLSQMPGAKEDGYLTLNELMNCDYHAKLVVLSACQTGSGKMERAEGVTGLTRAVMYAGTPCAVVSLWNVSEMGTKELMVKFYTNMLEKGMKKEEALRQAKLEMINGGKYSSPYFWSAFVMYGE